MNYTRLTIPEIEAELARTAADVRASFRSLDANRLNWCPEPDVWSVAQCLDHLVQGNHQMCVAMLKACEPGAARTIWQRLPGLHQLFGRVMVASLTPTATRKLTAPRPIRPSASHIDPGIVDRFIDGHAEIVTVIQALGGRDPARIVVVSPFVRFITYSILDALRLIAAHERRHYEQACRVLAKAP